MRGSHVHLPPARLELLRHYGEDGLPIPSLALRFWSTRDAAFPPPGFGSVCGMFLQYTTIKQLFFVCAKSSMRLHPPGKARLPS